jgi:hypothetical protein
MPEMKVPYEVNGRRFEGMIVYDGGMKTKRASAIMLFHTNPSSSVSIQLQRSRHQRGMLAR